MTRILGIDPALTSTGWGIIDAPSNRLSFVACGVIKTNATLPMFARLQTLHAELTKVIAEYQPKVAGLEETFVSVNGASTLKLGQARGALMLTLALAGLPVHEYAATLVKKSVVGVGRAEKPQVAMMVCTLLPESRAALEKLRHDAADALAIAICHANHSNTALRVG